MVGTVVDDSRRPINQRPVRKIRPTAALLQHAEKAALPSQQRTIDDFHNAEAAKHAKTAQESTAAGACFAASAASNPTLDAPVKAKRVHVEEVIALELSGEEGHDDTRTKSKRARIEEFIVDESDEEERENARNNPKRT
jgi:hypothetical protein